MTASNSPYLGRSFILGMCCLMLAAFAYMPVTGLFYYGGGWPFVQIVFIALYVIGVQQIRKSFIPVWLKWVLCSIPAVWLIGTQWENLTVG